MSWLEILIATHSSLPSKSGWSITPTDLVAYRTELIVMLWDVVLSRHLLKYGVLATSYLQVATILKVTSCKLLRFLANFLHIFYEYREFP